MVCKTCGAYNAEHLTNCKVCGAKLKSSEKIDGNKPEEQIKKDAYISENVQSESTKKEGGRPERHFTKSPAWPEKPFQASESSAQRRNPSRNDSQDISLNEEKSSEAGQKFYNEGFSGKSKYNSRSDSSAVKKNYCKNCNKELIDGAMFCPYCGTNNSPIEAPKTSVTEDSLREGNESDSRHKNSSFNTEAGAAHGFTRPRNGSLRPNVDSFNEYNSDDLGSSNSRNSKKTNTLKDIDGIDDMDDDFLFDQPSKKSAKSSLKKNDSKLLDDDFEDDLDEDFSDKKPSKKSKKGLFGKKKSADEDFDDSFDDIQDDEEEFDDDYYDQEFDDDEEEGKKKKGGTVLFIILVIVLLALIAFFGTYILKKNYGGSISNLVSSLKGTEQTATENAAEASANIVSTDTQTFDPNDLSATIAETELDGVEFFVITVHAPTGSIVKVLSKASLENDTATVQQDNQVAIRVQRAIFLPGDYCETSTVTVTPQLEITKPDGSTEVLNVPSGTVTVPQVSLIVSKPETNPVEATADGSAIEVSGTVDDYNVSVSVNGASVDVYANEDGSGIFSYEYTPVANQEGQTIEIVAKKENCKTASQIIEVTPYVVKDMSIEVTSSITALRAADGLVTIEGTVADGATVTATCDSDVVKVGDVVVSEGRFTCPVQISEEGCFTISFKGTGDGFNDGSTTCIVENMPSTKSSTYKTKALNVAKNYQKIVEGKADSKQLLFTGTIKEITSLDPYVVFRMEDSSGNSVYICNRSDRNKIDNDDIGKKKTVAGYNNGLYPETSNPYIWGWFIWNN